MTGRGAKPLPWLAGLLAICLVVPLVAGAQQIGLADWNSVNIDTLRQACVISIAIAILAIVVIAIGGCIPLARMAGIEAGKSTWRR